MIKDVRFKITIFMTNVDGSWGAKEYKEYIGSALMSDDVIENIEIVEEIEHKKEEEKK